MRVPRKFISRNGTQSVIIFLIAGLKLITVDQSFAEKHYADLSAKSLFRGMVDYIISGPMCAMFEEYSFNNYNSVFLYRKCPGYLLPACCKGGICCIYIEE